jgi:hypothetical protein
MGPLRALVEKNGKAWSSGEIRRRRPSALVESMNWVKDITGSDEVPMRQLLEEPRESKIATPLEVSIEMI